jgi:hypothetical protein
MKLAVPTVDHPVIDEEERFIVLRGMKAPSRPGALLPWRKRRQIRQARRINPDQLRTHGKDIAYGASEMERRARDRRVGISTVALSVITPATI